MTVLVLPPLEVPGTMPQLELARRDLHDLYQEFEKLDSHSQLVVYWSVRLMRTARQQALLSAIPGARFLAFGFFPRGRDEFGFGVIAYAHPNVEPRTSQLEPLEVDGERCSRC